MDPLITHDDPDQSKMIDQDAITELGLKVFQNHSAANVGFHLPPSRDFGSLVHPDHGSLFSPPPVLNKFPQLSVDLNILALQTGYFCRSLESDWLTSSCSQERLLLRGQKI